MSLKFEWLEYLQWTGKYRSLMPVKVSDHPYIGVTRRKQTSQPFNDNNTVLDTSLVPATYCRPILAIGAISKTFIDMDRLNIHDLQGILNIK